MTATSDCKPWCTDHHGPDCSTQFTIYDDGNEASEKVEPAAGSLAAQLKAVGGIPSEISWINLVAMQDEEDEQPVMALHFFEVGGDEPVSTLSVDANGLKELHSNLGGILTDFS